MNICCLLVFQMGLLLYDLSTTSFLLGLWSFFGLSVVAVVVPVLLAYAWLNVNLQVRLPVPLLLLLLWW